MAKPDSSVSLEHSEGTDRISSLPEALLSQILSLLSTKNAVATSLLSTRWKFVWTTSLSFDYRQAQKYSGETLIMKSQEFTQFVNSVLGQLNSPCIQNFNLSYHHASCDHSYLQMWISAAIGRTVQMLELHLVLAAKPMELPFSCFNCKTPAVLKLSGNIHFNVVASASICFPNLLTLDLLKIKFTIASNSSVSFPTLKDLLLDRVRYANEESVHKLFASCPVLDSLYLRSRYSNFSNNVRCFLISIPSLRSLKTRSSCNRNHEYKLQIDTPALEYLYLADSSCCQYFTLQNLSCLLKATVRFSFNQWSYRPLDCMKENEENIVKFIGGLVNVMFLSIPGYILKAIGSISENIAPVFSNLTRLEIHIYICHDLSFVLTHLLERTNNLRSLELSTLGSNCFGFHESWWMEPSSVPMCLLRRVTTISITTSGVCSSEHELVMYFLKNAEVLELLTIASFGWHPEDKINLMEKLSMTPRGSRACRVAFKGPLFPVSGINGCQGA